MMPLPPRYLQPVPLPTPFRPGDPRRLDPLGLHVRDTTDPHKVRDRLVDIGVLRKNGDGTYSPYLPTKADLVNGKVPASQLPGDQQGVTEVLVDGVSVVSGGTARINLTGKVDKEQGKGLSSNDYTAGEKNKLANIEAGAQKNVAPVVPSTDASAAGKPADAKATGEQLAAKLSKTEAADTYATKTALEGKYAKPQTGIPAADLAAAVQTSLSKADTALQTAPVQSVNGQMGAVVLSGVDILTYAYIGGVPIDNALIDLQANKADAADLRYALDEVLAPDASGAVTLADRAVNVVLLVNTIATLTLNFPASVSGHMRDFLVVIAAKADVTAPEIALPDGVVAANEDGAIPAIATTTESGGTAVTLLCFSEILADYFFVKGEGMKAVASE